MKGRCPICWPLAIGLALAAAGTAAGAIAKQKADDAQAKVLDDAQKDNTKTRNANRKILSAEVAREAPADVGALQNTASQQQQDASNTSANQAVQLFQGAGGNADVSGRVLADQQPRIAAQARMAGVGQARRVLSMQADRSNAAMDANNANLSRRLGLVPLQMQVAGGAGRGLAAAGGLAQGVGMGMAGGSMWGQAAGAGGQVLGGSATAGGGDLRGGAYPTQYHYVDPYNDPRTLQG